MLKFYTTLNRTRIEEIEKPEPGCWISAVAPTPEEIAFLKSDEKKIKVGYVHPELIFPLKQNRYLFVVARNNQFYALNSKLCKVVFVQ